MLGHDTPRRRDPDDWFASLGSASPHPERLAELQAAPPARISAVEDDEGEDWLGDDPRTRVRGESTVADSLSDRRVAIIAGVLLVACILVAGLVLAGIFSGSEHKRAATTTGIASTQTTTPSSTTHFSAPTVSPPTATLKPGDQGTQVRELQQALASLGYSLGTVDGNYGSATKSAVARFQSAAKLTADGIFGPATLAVLVSALSGP
jgi:hypothetical protein